MRYLARLLLLSTLVLPWAGCIENLSEADRSDTSIKLRLETELGARKDLNIRYVQITVDQRIVTVSGVVGTWDEKEAIERIVRHTRGVEQALINLAVQE